MSSYLCLFPFFFFFSRYLYCTKNTVEDTEERKSSKQGELKHIRLAVDNVPMLPCYQDEPQWVPAVYTETLMKSMFDVLKLMPTLC